MACAHDPMKTAFEECLPHNFRAQVFGCTDIQVDRSTPQSIAIVSVGFTGKNNGSVWTVSSQGLKQFRREWSHDDICGPDREDRFYARKIQFLVSAHQVMHAREDTANARLHLERAGCRYHVAAHLYKYWVIEGCPDLGQGAADCRRTDLKTLGGTRNARFLYQHIHGV